MNQNQLILKRFANLNNESQGIFHLRKSSQPLQEIKQKKKLKLNNESMEIMPDIVKKKETFDMR